mgnify:CR=1 FL=1
MTPEPERLSYWALVRLQFGRNRPAVVGLWCGVGLFALAIGAPLLALDQPFLWNDGQGLRFPLLAALFNRLLFENGVDIFFNLLLVLAPVYALAGWLLRRSGRLTLWTASGLIGLHLALTALVVPQSWFGAPNPFHREAPIVDYRVLETQRLEAGEPVTAWFPARRIHYRETDPERSVQAPGPQFLLGTDLEGRDVFVRMLYGTRISLTIGVVAVAIYVWIGIVLGALAGYFGGWVDVAISRLIEVMICIPSFFLILTLVALVQDRSIFHVMVIIGVTSWTGVARLVRAEFLQQRELEYALAARALGLPRWRVIFRHILPNALGPVLVSATFGVASAIITESSLAFLGLGDLSVPSWGETLNAGRLEMKPWLIFAPGLAIFFVVSVFNLVGEGLRDALDPQMRT